MPGLMAAKRSRTDSRGSQPAEAGDMGDSESLVGAETEDDDDEDRHWRPIM